jgi:lipid A 3-O-deacylase
MTKLLVGVFLFAQAICACAVDSVSAEQGQGSRGVDLWRVGAQWNQEIAWLARKDWQLYWDASLGGWYSETGTVLDIGLTPVFRHARHPRGVYFDAGIGFHMLSGSRVSRDLTLSTRFQFGDHLGIGYRFAHYDLGMRFQHLSNAGLRNPNPGINFLQLRLQYHFD